MNLVKSILLLLLLPIGVQAEFSSLTHQVQNIQSALGNPQNNYQKISSSVFRGFRNPKAAIKGALYWGGVDGGNAPIRTPLSASAQQSLCQTGFSRAYFVYGNPNKTVYCDGNAMTYQIVRQPNERKPNSPNLYEFLKSVHTAITSNGAVGPVYMHCRYGVHASNTLAAIALRQFCGWTVSEAVEHWNKFGHYPDPHNKALSAAGKQENRNKVANFVPYTDLLISDDLKSQVCFQFH